MKRVRIEINIHHSINHKSHRDGLVSYGVMGCVKCYYKGQMSHRVDDLESPQYPTAGYPLYSKQWGKHHSQYKKF